MDYYIHSINPVLLPIWGHLAIRWYGLAYVAGFVAAYLLLNRLGRRGEFGLKGEPLQALLVNLVIGVMVGGRLGYMLFYNFAEFARDPLVLFRLWEGGMASHGGMVGMAVATAYSARRFNLPFLGITDGLVCVGPLGLLFGRLANFINGELWGRVTNVPWAVVFPQEAGLHYGEPGYLDLARDFLARGLLHPRHPSQLYQAFGEGVVVLAVLWLVRRTIWSRTPGRLSGLFLSLYAIMRFITEFFREPEIVHFGWLSQGQLLSLALLLPAGIWLMARPATAPSRS